ncbi:MAG TPA: ROK family transcriptional regulator, partial [Ornithinibacter sp.]|nr:ROK family transcriptional regulator [Ornithinibacter sp.]
MPQIPSDRAPGGAPAARAPAVTGGARQSSLREGNLALVARTVCGAEEPLSRAGVAERTAMTRSTVSRLVDDLVAGGVLAELDPLASTGRGRPATPLVAGGRLVALGLQVDVTLLSAKLVDLRGRVVAESVVEGDFLDSDPGETLVRLAALSAAVVQRMPSASRLVGAGLALPGIVSTDSGRLLVAPNLGWSDLRPAALVDAAALGGMPLHVGNEASLAARTVAEVVPGRPGPLTDFVYLSGEIGIGGAAVLGGRVMAGRHGWAGEIGHVCVDPSGPDCACGSTGCLEQYAGRRALLAAAGLPADAGTTRLVDLVRSGDRAAADAVARAAWALGVALAGVVNVLDIPAIVLGGHLGQ